MNLALASTANRFLIYHAVACLCVSHRAAHPAGMLRARTSRAVDMCIARAAGTIPRRATERRGGGRKTIYNNNNKQEEGKADTAEENARAADAIFVRIFPRGTFNNLPAADLASLFP